MNWRDNLRKTEPYVAGEQPQKENVIKLNTNENPYPPAPKVQKIASEFCVDILKKYPDPCVRKLNHAIAQYHGLQDEQIFSGVGSDDVLSMAFLTAFSGKEPVLFPDITYAFYPVWANLYRIPFRTVPLKEDFTIDRTEYYGDGENKNGGVVIANPNAPTAIAQDLDFIEDICKHNPYSVVIVDEAYVDFGGVSALPLLKKYENLLVVRTFSKSRSMAGIRIGYACGSPELITAMNGVKESVNSYTMNHITIALGVASIEEEDYFQTMLHKVIATRENFKEELQKLDFVFTDSKTNFLFAGHKTVPAAYIFEKLRERNIFVRYWNKPRIRNYLRITIGTDEEMRLLSEALKEIIAAYQKK